MLCRIVELKVFIDILKFVHPNTGRFHLVQSAVRTGPDRVLMIPHHNKIQVVTVETMGMKLAEINQ